MLDIDIDEFRRWSFIGASIMPYSFADCFAALLKSSCHSALVVVAEDCDPPVAATVANG